MDRDVEIAMKELGKINAKTPSKKPVRANAKFDFVPPFLPMTREEVEHAIRLSRSTIYAMMNPNSDNYSPDFPRPVQWGKRAVMWKQHEIAEWMNTRERTAAIDSDEA